MKSQLTALALLSLVECAFTTFPLSVHHPCGGALLHARALGAVWRNQEFGRSCTLLPPPRDISSVMLGGPALPPLLAGPVDLGLALGGNALARLGP